MVCTGGGGPESSLVLSLQTGTHVTVGSIKAQMATDSARADIMSLDEFMRWFVSEIEWSPVDISEDSDLVEDLGMDSIGAVDLMTAIEDAVGGEVVMPIELVLQISTLRDAYLQYCALAQLPYEGDVQR
jgi:acyl carrier protein